MKLYDKVILKEDFESFKKGNIGVIVEIYDDENVFLEMINEDGETVGLIYCIPIDKLERN